MDDAPADRTDVPREPAAPAPSHKALRLVVQLVGFLASVALLGWCVQMAMSPGNRAQMERLGNASAWQIAGLLGLSGVSLGLNGLAFWIGIQPVHKLGIVTAQATNAIATLLGYLPFKLSVISRALIHNRRDKVPILTIGAWFAAVGVLMVAAPVPLVVASAARPTMDALWWVIAVGGLAVLGAAQVFSSRFFAGERGLDRIASFIKPIPIASAHRFIRSSIFTKLHDAFTILACPRVVTASNALWLCEYLSRAGRFVIAASVLGVEMSWSDAMVLSSVFFLVGVLSPFGMIGTREAGAIGIAAWFGMATTGESTMVVLLVSAPEAIINLVGGAMGVAWLRPDRLLKLGASQIDQTIIDDQRAEAAQALSSPDETRPGADQPDHRGPDPQQRADPPIH